MAIPDLQTLPSIPLPDSLDPPSPVIIERVRPEIDGGRYPVKRVQGDILEVSADIFPDVPRADGGECPTHRARLRGSLGEGP